MIKLLRFIPIQLTFFLICGIVLSKFLKFNITTISYVLAFLIILLVVFYEKAKAYGKYSASLFQGIVYVCFILFGISSVYIHSEINDSKHYSNSVGFSESTSTSATLKITNQLKSTNNYYKFEANVSELNSNFSKGKILISFKKDSEGEVLKVDDEIVVKTSFQPIPKALNPYSFDYKSYLKNQQIYHQIYVENTTFLKSANPTTSIYGIAFKVRESINESLAKNGLKNDELAVINALLLGQRQSISEDLLQSYTNAGAIHILAVSGLHIGVILLLLTYLFKPLHSFKNGKLVASLLVICCLWLYAVLAGLSPSVVRAVTMFTALSIGLHLNKPSNVYNTLGISMFFLLLFRPSFLVEVGFQLSYLAVFSIVWIQPKLYELLKFKWWFFDKTWQLLTVSLAAQLGVLPLSLYYFHQFPSLFFVANLLIIPALGFILIGGIIVIILALVNGLPWFIANFYGFVISILNTIVTWVASFDKFVFQNISVSFVLMIAFYCCIVAFVKWFENRQFNRLMLLLISIVFLQSIVVSEKYKVQSSNEFIVFNDYRNPVIAIRKGDLLSINGNQLTYEVKNYITGLGLNKIILREKKDFVYKIKNETILVVDSLGIYNLKTVKPSVVIVRNSPKINIERLIKTIHPKLIVFETSNYKSYIKTWEEICIKNKTPFYNISEKGAFIMKE